MPFFVWPFGKKPKPKKDTAPKRINWAEVFHEEPQEVTEADLLPEDRTYEVTEDDLLPEEGKLEPGGWLGRRPDLGESPYEDFEKPWAPEDVEDRHLSQSDVDQFLRGEVALMVDSSNVESLKYDPHRGWLQVTYLDKGDSYGVAWEYQLPPRMVRNLAEAHSKGKWLWDHVRVRGKGNKHRHQVPARRLR